MKSTKSLFRISAAIAVASLLGTFVHAAPIPMTGKVMFKDTPYRGTAGEFQADVKFSSGVDFSDPNDDRDDILTFCLEMTEYINLNTWYDYSISTKALAGGNNNQTGAISGEDIISQGTAYLFSLFHVGYGNGKEASAQWQELGNYGGADRKDDAILLQKAIWSLEDEQTSGTGFVVASNKFLKLVEDKFGSLTTARLDFSETSSRVRVMNPTQNGTFKQSQLVYLPDGGVTAILLGGALAALGLARRRMGRS